MTELSQNQTSTLFEVWQGNRNRLQMARLFKAGLLVAQ